MNTLLSSLLATIVLITPVAFSVVAVQPVHADHCGGAALGHPGGPEVPCESLVPGYTEGSGNSNSLENPIRFNSLSDVLFAIVDILIILAVPIIIFFIIYAGFLYVTAQGNPTKIADANRALLFAVIGGVIIIGARVIASIIESTVAGFSS